MSLSAPITRSLRAAPIAAMNISGQYNRTPPAYMLEHFLPAVVERSENDLEAAGDEDLSEGFVATRAIGVARRAPQAESASHSQPRVHDESPLRTPWLRRGLIALVVVIAVAAAVAWLGRGKAVSVVVTEIARGKVESTVANTRAGTVEACQRTKLSTIAGGRIEVLAVKEGDRVKKGQVLMKLWNDDQQAQQTLALAQLETSRRRATEACTTAAAAEREAQAPGAAARAGLRVERGARTTRAPRPMHGAPAARPRTPTCARRRRASTSRASSRAAPWSSRRSTARSPRSSARSASTRRPRRPACRRRRRST